MIKTLFAAALAIALMAVLGQSLFNVILALSIVYIPRMARISRSAALVVKEQTYIEALRSQGASSFRIIWRHIAPNILPAVVVQASYNFADAVRRSNKPRVYKNY